MTDRDMNMVHYPVFAEPFVLVVIRGALDMLQLIQPQVADIPLARAACDWSKPLPELHVVGTSPLTAALALHVVRISPLTAALSTRVTMQVMQVMQLTQAKS